MKMPVEDLHYMTEIKTCVYPAPGPTKTYHPSHCAAVIEWKALWKQVSFAKIIILGVTPSEPTAVLKKGGLGSVSSPHPLPHPHIHLRTKARRRDHIS